MISLLCLGLGLAVRNQPEQQQQSLQASPNPAASPAAQAQGAGIDWASGAKLPEGAVAPAAVPAAVPAAAPAVAPIASAVAPAVPAVPAVVQPEAPVAPTAVAVAPTAADGIAPLAGASCISIQPGTSDYWCSATCASSVCPETICKCGDGAQQQAASKLDDAMASHQANEQKVRDAAQAMADASASPLPMATLPEALPVDPEHAAAEQKVKDAMGANVDEMKEKVAQQAAASPVPAAQPAAPVPEQQQAQAKPAGKACKALVATATDQWCQNTCSEVPSQIVAVTPTSYCPKEICECK